MKINYTKLVILRNLQRLRYITFKIVHNTTVHMFQTSRMNAIKNPV
jgi:hypothetical protein